MLRFILPRSLKEKVYLENNHKHIYLPCVYLLCGKFLFHLQPPPIPVTFLHAERLYRGSVSLLHQPLFIFLLFSFTRVSNILLVVNCGPFSPRFFLFLNGLDCMKVPKAEPLCRTGQGKGRAPPYLYWDLSKHYFVRCKASSISTSSDALAVRCELCSKRCCCLAASISLHKLGEIEFNWECTWSGLLRTGFIPQLPKKKNHLWFFSLFCFFFFWGIKHLHSWSLIEIRLGLDIIKRYIIN